MYETPHSTCTVIGSSVEVRVLFEDALMTW